MPDDVGRYTLGEMRERVWRKLDAVRPAVDPNTGEESFPIQFDPLYSRNDVDQSLNTSLTAKYTEIVLNNRMTYADEETIDVVANTVEYPLPTDLSILRSLWWKDPRDVFMIVPPNARTYMNPYDDEGPVPSDLSKFAPTYRRTLNNIVLNETPDVDNPQGILVRYIKWVQHLVQDADILETEFAQIIQEVIILDAAIKLITEKSQIDPPATWVQDRSSWETRLALLARNASMPESVRFRLNNKLHVARP